MYEQQKNHNTNSTDTSRDNTPSTFDRVRGGLHAGDKLPTFEAVTEFIRIHKHMGWDEYIQHIDLPKKQVIALWNQIHKNQWKVFTRTLIDDYIEDTGRKVDGRTIYRFIKPYIFYPTANESIVIPKGWEYDFMSIPVFAQRIIPSDSEWGKLASLLHDYRFLTRTATFIMTSLEFATNLRRQGAKPWQWIACYLAVQTGGYIPWIRHSAIECRLNLIEIKKRSAEYYKENGGLDKQIDQYNHILGKK